MQARQQAAGLRHRPETTTVFGVSQVALFGFAADKFRRRLWDDAVVGDHAFALIDTAPGYFSSQYPFGKGALNAAQYFWLVAHRCIPAISARPWSTPSEATQLPGGDQVEEFARVNALYNRCEPHLHRLRLMAGGGHVVWLDAAGSPAVMWVFADDVVPCAVAAQDLDSGVDCAVGGVIAARAGHVYLLDGHQPAASRPAADVAQHARDDGSAVSTGRPSVLEHAAASPV